MRKWMLIGIFALLAVAGLPGQANALESGGCATTLGNCYESAAAVDSFWYRWAAGIDCELDFVECARIKLIGG